MSFCGQCGQQQETGDIFCPSCGAPRTSLQSGMGAKETGLTEMKDATEEFEDRASNSSGRRRKNKILIVCALSVAVLAASALAFGVFGFGSTQPQIQGGATEQQVHSLYHATKGSGVA